MVASTAQSLEDLISNQPRITIDLHHPVICVPLSATSSERLEVDLGRVQVANRVEHVASSVVQLFTIESSAVSLFEPGGSSTASEASGVAPSAFDGNFSRELLKPIDLSVQIALMSELPVTDSNGSLASSRPVVLLSTAFAERAVQFSPSGTFVEGSCANIRLMLAAADVNKIAGVLSENIGGQPIKGFDTSSLRPWTCGSCQRVNPVNRVTCTCGAALVVATTVSSAPPMRFSFSLKETELCLLKAGPHLARTLSVPTATTSAECVQLLRCDAPLLSLELEKRSDLVTQTRLVLDTLLVMRPEELDSLAVAKFDAVIGRMDTVRLCVLQTPKSASEYSHIDLDISLQLGNCELRWCPPLMADFYAYCSPNPVASAATRAEEGPAVPDDRLRDPLPHVDVVEVSDGGERVLTKFTASLPQLHVVFERQSSGMPLFALSMRAFEIEVLAKPRFTATVGSLGCLEVEDVLNAETRFRSLLSTASKPNKSSEAKLVTGADQNAQTQQPRAVVFSLLNWDPLHPRYPGHEREISVTLQGGSSGSTDSAAANRSCLRLAFFKNLWLEIIEYLSDGELLCSLLSLDSICLGC